MISKNTHIGFLAPITWPIPPRAYGAWERVVSNLIAGLKSKGYKKITLFATQESRIPGVKTIACIPKPLGVKNKRVFDLLHISHAMSHLQTVDILHNHLNYAPLLFHKFVDVPIVTTMHGSAIEPESKIAYKEYKSMPFVSISNFERTILPELNYVATVYNPVDFGVFTLGRHPKKYLVQTGRMHPDKGVHHAIVLAKALRIPLYLAGPIEDSCIEYFNKQIRPHVDGKRVFYLGNLSPYRVHKLVSGAMAFVALIDWEEPFGLSVAESMASGTPVIGTPRGAHRETIQDGLTGILVKNVKEAVSRFPEIEAIDREHCRKISEEAFSIDVATRGYLEVYEKVIKQYHRQP